MILVRLLLIDFDLFSVCCIPLCPRCPLPTITTATLFRTCSSRQLQLHRTGVCRSWPRNPQDQGPLRNNNNNNYWDPFHLGSQHEKDLKKGTLKLTWVSLRFLKWQITLIDMSEFVCEILFFAILLICAKARLMIVF
jgi:hypothetical protein